MHPIAIIDQYQSVVTKGITSLIAPLNQKQEKEKFIKQSGYVPQFIYKDVDTHAIAQARKILEQQFELEDEALYHLYQAKINELKTTISLLECIGSNSITDFSDTLFLTHDIHVDAVEDVRQKTPTNTNKNIHADIVKEKIENIFAEYHINQWHIVNEDHMLSRGVVRGSKKTFVLKKDAEFRDEEDVKGFIAHEIYGHVFRYQNGSQQDDKIFHIGTAGSVVTEEGIASRNRLNVVSDERAQLLKNTMQLRAYAACIAKKENFKNTFDALYECTKDPDRSWALTMRVKRGISNGKDIGAYTKDAIYYMGVQKVEKFTKTNDVKRLFVGRIGVDDLDVVEKLKLRQPQWFNPDVSV